VTESPGSSPGFGVVRAPPSAAATAASPAPNGRATVALQILDLLQQFGVDTVFGIPGGAVSTIYGALVARPGIRLITAKHETGAVFLAMGHAMATGQLGVVVTTAGPGITNALTGITSAYYEDVPILVIAGEVPTTAFGRGALQESSAAEFDAVSLMRRCTKFAAQIVRADSAVALAQKAIRISLSGRRGPSFLSLPLNVSGTVTAPPSIGGHVDTSFEIDAAACRRAMTLLVEARRPFILAGAGCRSSASRAALLRLAEATGASVAVSPKGKSVFPEDHPLYLGVFGFGGHESVIQCLQSGVDVLLVCGSSLNDFATNAWSPLLSASKAFLHIDIDAAQLGNNYPIDLGLVGPVDLVIHKMLEEVPAPPHRVPALQTGVVAQATRSSPSKALTTAEVALTMNEICPADAVYTSDMGEHLGIALHYLRVRSRGHFVTCLGFGSMGSGVCTAIGYQLAAPSRRVYAVTGDGCVLMYGSELATAVQHRVPVTIVIINDSRLNMCQLGFRDQFGASPDLTTQMIEFVQVARGMGAMAYLVRTRKDLIAALQAPVDGPVVLDVRIDPEIRLEGSQRTAALRQFHTE
jgi:acetolactate synthase-1/2/3 large subunit